MGKTAFPLLGLEASQGVSVLLFGLTLFQQLQREDTLDAPLCEAVPGVTFVSPHPRSPLAAPSTAGRFFLLFFLFLLFSLFSFPLYVYECIFLWV